ncbi:uncharacterized protein LOC132686832 [Panthera onca]
MRHRPKVDRASSSETRQHHAVGVADTARCGPEGGSCCLLSLTEGCTAPPPSWAFASLSPTPLQAWSLPASFPEERQLVCVGPVVRALCRRPLGAGHLKPRRTRLLTGKRGLMGVAGPESAPGWEDGRPRQDSAAEKGRDAPAAGVALTTACVSGDVRCIWKIALRFSPQPSSVTLDAAIEGGVRMFPFYGEAERRLMAVSDGRGWGLAPEPAPSGLGESSDKELPRERCGVSLCGSAGSPSRAPAYAGLAVLLSAGLQGTSPAPPGAGVSTLGADSSRGERGPGACTFVTRREDRSHPQQRGEKGCDPCTFAKCLVELVAPWKMVSVWN